MTQSFCGGIEQFEITKARLIQQKADFEVIVNGTRRSIIKNNIELLFTTTQEAYPTIVYACRQVANDLRSYVKKKEAIMSHGPTDVEWTDTSLISSYIEQGGREFGLIDARACYWTVALQEGLISQGTFDRYVDNKAARLVAIGNLNKRKHIQKFVAGVEIKDSFSAVPSDHFWAWNHIVSKVYDIFKQVRDELDGCVWKFKTDAVFVLPEAKRQAVESIRRLGLITNPEEDYMIVGRQNSYLVSKNLETEDLRRTSVGTWIRHNSFLEPVSKDLFANTTTFSNRIAV